MSESDFLLIRMHDCTGSKKTLANAGVFLLQWVNADIPA